MDHEHVLIPVLGATLLGMEEVPAHSRGNGVWEILKSPLYATGVAAGDLIEKVGGKQGDIKIVRRGGNVCVQFFLAEDQADNEDITYQLVDALGEQLQNIGGRVDGRTLGLVTCTVPLAAGFAAIENVFLEATQNFPRSEWQYGNVYHPSTGQPIDWWKTSA